MGSNYYDNKNLTSDEENVKKSFYSFIFGEKLE